MRYPDKRNVLHIGPPEHTGETEITPAMVEIVRQRIKDAGGILTVWAVLHEDVYETRLGDGFYLHVEAMALNGEDAERLAACPPYQSGRNGMCAATGSVWKTICRHSSHCGGPRKNSRLASS